MSENNNMKENMTPKTKAEKKAKVKSKKSGEFKKFIKSRKAHHGTIAVAIVAVVIAIVIIINVICGLLVDRFPDLNLDLTANQSFALQDDTIDYVSHLDKDVSLDILMSESDFVSNGTYFVQAKNLLDKMESNSNGNFKVNYVDLVTNPNYTSNYPNVDWESTDNNYIALVVCNDQYKALTLAECFTYDATYVEYYGYQFTATTIEQAVVTGILNVTTEDKVIVDVLTGYNEQDCSGVKNLLTQNAYQVNEVSLVTGEIEDNAEFVLLFAPSVDLDESAIDKISEWLDNDGKYGKSLIYIPCADNVDTPNLDALLDDWGMAVNDGYVFETSGDYMISASNPYAFIVNYTDYYTSMLKNSKIPIVVSDTHDIIINDSEIAHPVLTTSDNVGIQPYSPEDNWDYRDALTGEALNIAAEGVITNNDDTSSRVVVFGTYMMFDETIMSYNSFNNSAFFMNMVNTIADKDDIGITIETKSLDSEELGVTDVTTQTVMFVIFVVIIPLAVLATGLVTWLRRRNK